MKTIDIKFNTTHFSKDDMSYKNYALKNGAISSLDFDVLSGNYSEIDKQSDDKDIKKENRFEAFAQAQCRLQAYMFNTNEIVKKEKIALAVEKLQGCTKYDVVEIFIDGNKFTAVDDSTNEKVSGEFRIMNGVIRFVFNDLEIIRDNYIEKENKQLKADGCDESSLLTIEDTHSEAVSSALMDLWVAKNPMPEHTGVNDEKYAFLKAMWSLKKDEACCFFNNESTKYDFSDRYELSIKQAIDNKKDGETALSSALNYVEKLIG